MNYLVFAILFTFTTLVHATLYKNVETIDLNNYEIAKEAEIVLRRSRRDEDYSDEGGFMSSPGHSGDDDFIANIRDCSAGSTRAPWGRCISCGDYQRKFRRIGMGC